MDLGDFLRGFVQTRWRRFGERTAFLHWQARQMKQHLQWVSQHSNFYKDYAGQPLHQWPVMNKALMLAHFNNTNTVGLDRDWAMDNALKAEKDRDFKQVLPQNISVGLSSGTSGQRGLFVTSKGERAYWAGFLLGRMLPEFPWQSLKVALLLRAGNALYNRVQGRRLKFQYIDIQKPFQYWRGDLETFAPDIVFGNAQALQYCAAQAVAIAPKRMISGAEVLSAVDKAFIAAHYNCPVHEIYQCTEGFLACTHSDGVLRFNEDWVHIEPDWLDPEHTRFSPIVTDFRRRAQPMIRYRLDDVILHKSEATCTFRGIDKIVGRSGDCLIFCDRANNPVHIFPDLVQREISLMCAHRVDYRLTQVHKDKLLIESDQSHTDIHQAVQQVLTRFHCQPVQINYAPAPRWSGQKKLRRVVNQSVS